jgi:hypothetical protein
MSLLSSLALYLFLPTSLSSLKYSIFHPISIFSSYILYIYFYTFLITLTPIYDLILAISILIVIVFFLQHFLFYLSFLILFRFSFLMCVIGLVFDEKSIGDVFIVYILLLPYLFVILFIFLPILPNRFRNLPLFSGLPV